MKLKVYIDIYGRIGLCEKFKNTEEYCGLNEMLRELVDEDFYGDRYTDFKPGFYKAEFEITSNTLYDPQDEDCYLHINKIGEL